MFRIYNVICLEIMLLYVVIYDLISRAITLIVSAASSQQRNVFTSARWRCVEALHSDYAKWAESLFWAASPPYIFCAIVKQLA